MTLPANMAGIFTEPQAPAESLTEKSQSEFAVVICGLMGNILVHSGKV
ncbi:MAG: hypothetical protein IKQ95_05720 [Synergistaceae bacterium]|nr:hypothetical protein [Synergistaceae bacterium]